MEGKQKPTGPPEEEQKAITPMAMAEIAIMKAESAKSAADKNPGIRSVALLLLAILCINTLSQVATYLIVESFNTTHTDFFSAMLTSNGVFGAALLLVQAAAIFTLLLTRSVSLAKTIILIAGISFGVSTVISIAHFDIGPAITAHFATLLVNLLLFQKIIKVYLEL